MATNATPSPTVIHAETMPIPSRATVTMVVS